MSSPCSGHLCESVRPTVNKAHRDDATWGKGGGGVGEGWIKVLEGSRKDAGRAY